MAWKTSLSTYSRRKEGGVRKATIVAHKQEMACPACGPAPSKPHYRPCCKFNVREWRYAREIEFGETLPLDRLLATLVSVTDQFTPFGDLQAL